MSRLDGVRHYDDATREFLASILQGHFDEIPNSIATLALRPEILRAAVGLWRAVMADGTVERPLKWMVGNLASKAHGCRYCAAHTVNGAGRSGVAPEKLDALWSFESSPLFDDREKTALRFGLLAAQVPNGLDDAHFADMKQHFGDAQIAEILAVVSVYGFFNRWNDSLATPLEAAPLAAASSHLARSGWTPGRHGPAND